VVISDRATDSGEESAGYVRGQKVRCRAIDFCGVRKVEESIPGVTSPGVEVPYQVPGPRNLPQISGN